VFAFSLQHNLHVGVIPHSKRTPRTLRLRLLRLGAADASSGYGVLIGYPSALAASSLHLPMRAVNRLRAVS